MVWRAGHPLTGTSLWLFTSTPSDRFFFCLYLFFSWSPLRTSCLFSVTVFFWIGWSLPALPLWTRWPAPDCSSSGSSWHWSASVLPLPLLSWWSGRSRHREIRTTSMRACGRPAALMRKQSVNLTSPSSSWQVSFFFFFITSFFISSETPDPACWDTFHWH